MIQREPPISDSLSSLCLHRLSCSCVDRNHVFSVYNFRNVVGERNAFYNHLWFPMFGEIFKSDTTKDIFRGEEQRGAYYQRR